ncbi:SGNH/GDSL hydrolase family protein [uncultured Ruegeria sp.]|uniref:SGNH/GDSL hydrolase family protein n=1 Tax=uncultured Ruegeria sp. TaxID=259304 RepID=UPI002608F0EF|nr:SGNH/GDSL hydrolase family protein [uncultured Ruegeria sp.]
MLSSIGADQILRVPLLPILALQGLVVRRDAQFLPEPTGPRDGREGRGPRLRLLIAGDSSAAGVGAGTQRQALSGQLVSRLAMHHTVEWRLEATTGHTTQDTINRLQEMHEPFDVVVTALGVNDVTRAVHKQRFETQQRQLLTLLTGQMRAQKVIVTAVPQMALFPALPQPLAWVLGQQAARLDRGLQNAVAGFPQATHLALDLPDDPALAALDGYHPSPKTYAIWAEELTRIIHQA